MSIVTDMFGTDKYKVGRVHMDVLQAEIRVLKTRLKPEDTGHIHTTIGVLESRVEEISKALYHEYMLENPA